MRSACSAVYQVGGHSLALALVSHAAMVPIRAPSVEPMIMSKLSHGGSTATKTQRPIMVSALSLRSGGYSSNLAVKPMPRVRRMGGFISSRIADIIAAIALSCTAREFLICSKDAAHPYERPHDLNVYGNRAFS